MSTEPWTVPVYAIGSSWPCTRRTKPPPPGCISTVIVYAEANDSEICPNVVALWAARSNVSVAIVGQPGMANRPHAEPASNSATLYSFWAYTVTVVVCSPTTVHSYRSYLHRLWFLLDFRMVPFFGSCLSGVWSLGTVHAYGTDVRLSRFSLGSRMFIDSASIVINV